MSDFLFDTCAVIWISNGDEIATDAAHALNKAHSRGNRSHVSPFSAWELGVLVARGRLRLTRSVHDWFSDFIDCGGMALAPLTFRILADASVLPGNPPNDPADRIIIATARAENLIILTRDRLILGYAAEGHVRALAC